MNSNFQFCRAFRTYRPFSQKVYGVVLISDNDRVLVVKGSRTGKYSFPKGHINAFENVRDCAKREFREETGLNCDNYKELGYQHLSAGGYYFYHSPSEDVPTLDEQQTEIESVQWMTVDDLRSQNVNVDVSVFLRRADNILKMMQ
jgi:8-oxo-dGTP pyrophosphatase MutT (NUDIX family)